MPSIAHLYQAVETLLIESGCDLPRAARQRLVSFVLGVLLAGSIVLRRVATTHSYISLGATSAASHERRLRRTLNDPHLGQAAPMYARVVRRVLRRLPAGQRLWLIIDESGHTDVVRALVAALWYRGRALPLAWLSWPAQTPVGEHYWRDCQLLLQQLAALLPAEQPVTVLADRAFGCPAFFDLVVGFGWQYVLRVQEQTRLRQHDGSEQALCQLLSKPGSCWSGQGWAFKKQGWREVSVLAYWRVGCKKPLLLVSNLAASGELVLQYRRRSAIEALFRDWKSSGWQWEASQVRDAEHQAVMLLVLALTTLLTFCLGEELAEAVLAQPRQQGYRRPWHARDSLFRLGRERLWQRLWRGEESDYAWELKQFAAPNWSQQCWQAALPAPKPVQMTGRVGKRERRRAA
jgi:hypothetical protein